MQRPYIQSFAPGEIYHVYNRGAHKADVFKNDSDYVRMQSLMYLANGDRKIVMRDILKRNDGDRYGFFDEEELREYVDVLAYCLMKNHYHFVLRPISEDGVEKFMKKVMTGYSMYSNKKYAHSGTMWEGPFKARWVDSDAYLWQLFVYIHVNPVEYVEKFWKEDKTLDVQSATQYLQNYHYSSCIDMYMGYRPESKILTRDEDFTKWKKNFPNIQNMIEYYLRQDFSDVQNMA